MIRPHLLAVPIAALLAVAVAAEPPLSPSAFRERFAAAVTEASGRPTVRVDERTFATKLANGTDVTVSIDNAYVEYQADPSRLVAILAKYSEVLLRSGQIPSEPLERLVVIVRPTDYIRRSLPPSASLANFVPSRPMAGDLSFFLAVDSEQSIRSAVVADLARWKIDEATAWRRAIANLEDRIGPVAPTHLGSEAGAFGFGAASGLAPSLLADPMLCGPATKDMNGQLVLLYTRDMFLLADPKDEVMTKKFWSAVDAEVTAGRSLSSTPLTCRDGRWVTATHP